MVRVVRSPDASPAGADDAQQLPAGDAGLENLARQAEALADTPPPGAPPGAPGPELPPDELPRLTNAQAITGALKVLRDVFCAFTGFNSPKENLPDEHAAGLGEAWGAVADKHGFDLVALAGDYAAEIAAVVATAPIALAIHTGMKAEMQARDQARAKPAQIPDAAAPATAAPAAPAANAPGFTPGVVVPAFAQ